MSIIEAKAKISNEFMARYHEWLLDHKRLSNLEYAQKYGYQKADYEMKDCLKSIISFQKYIYSGRYLPAWEKAGYDKQDIWALYRNGFLSLAYHSDWMSRVTGQTYFYYINQTNAKEIYRGTKQ